MRGVRSTIILATLWSLLSGRFDPATLLTGLLVGFAAVAISTPIVGSRRDEPADRPGRRRGALSWIARGVPAFVRLALLYSYDLIASNLAMARDVLSPRPNLEPAIFALQVEGLGALETTVLANLIGLTPGTMPLDFDESTSTLYIQTLYARDIDRLKDEMRRYARLISEINGRQPPGDGSEASR